MFQRLTSLYLRAVAFLRFANRVVRRHRSRHRPKVFLPGQHAVRKSLFTEAEQSFYGVLVGLELPGVRILAKVRLADVFEARQRKEASGWGTISGAILQKPVDFLLVRDGDCCPLMGIELDDSSHRHPDRGERARFVHALFSDCGLPLLKVPSKRGHSAATVRRLIYDVAPLNFPLSDFAETLATALQPRNGRPEFARAR